MRCRWIKSRWLLNRRVWIKLWLRHCLRRARGCSRRLFHHREWLAWIERRLSLHVRGHGTAVGNKSRRRRDFVHETFRRRNHRLIHKSPRRRGRLGTRRPSRRGGIRSRHTQFKSDHIGNPHRPARFSKPFGERLLLALVLSDKRFVERGVLHAQCRIFLHGLRLPFLNAGMRAGRDAEHESEECENLVHWGFAHCRSQAHPHHAETPALPRIVRSRCRTSIADAITALCGMVLA